MSINIALVGNPNCGKTTLFNNLTGSSQYVGNWPGVTVEKKEGKLKKNKNVKITDLPGIYSLSPYTSEEIVSRDFLLKEKPSSIINIIDGTNLERNLYLTTQLMEMGIPIVLAINMMDIVKKNNDEINIKKLSEAMQCQAVEISALKSFNTTELSKIAVDIASNDKSIHAIPKYSENFEKYLADITDIILSNKLINQSNIRWYTIKVFERDKNVMHQLNLSNNVICNIEKIIQLAEKDFDDDSQSIVINERYNYITKLIPYFYKKSPKKVSTADKIDNILTNNILAIPIFIAIISFVYLISITLIGKPVSDWLNESVFNNLIKSSLSTFLEQIGTASWLSDLLINGIISGVGSVLSFVPQIFVLFLFLSLLEDCGYMSRIAFIMDKILHKFGFSGKSFIPFLISSGCTVPGIMSTKIIENKNERLITIITASFIPCSAKVPVIALICGAILPEIWYIAPIIYFVCMFIVIISGTILKKTKLFSDEKNHFVMELPSYHMPSIKTIAIHVIDRVKSFIVKAGTVIFLASIVIWFLSNFGINNNGFNMVDKQDSFLAAIGKIISPLFYPLGFNNWEAAVATISGLIAKENIINTIGVTSELSENTINISEKITNIFSNSLAAISFLAFNLICAPCCAAIGAIYRQTSSFKWTGFAILFQTITAYITSLFIYQIFGLIFGYLQFGLWSIISLVLIALIIFLVLKPHKSNQEQ